MLQPRNFNLWQLVEDYYDNRPRWGFHSSQTRKNAEAKKYVWGKGWLQRWVVFEQYAFHWVFPVFKSQWSRLLRSIADFKCDFVCSDMGIMASCFVQRQYATLISWKEHLKAVHWFASRIKPASYQLRNIKMGFWSRHTNLYVMLIGLVLYL